MSYNNENDLETLNILMISYAALGCSEIAVQGALKSCISQIPFNNFVCTLVQKKTMRDGIACNYSKENFKYSAVTNCLSSCIQLHCLLTTSVVPSTAQPCFAKRMVLALPKTTFFVLFLALLHIIEKIPVTFSKHSSHCSLHTRCCASSHSNLHLSTQQANK